MFLDSWFEYLNLKNGSRISDLSLHDPFAIFSIIVLIAIIPIAIILLTVTARKSAESIWDGLRHDARFRDLRRARTRPGVDEEPAAARSKDRKSKGVSFWLPESSSRGGYASLPDTVGAPERYQAVPAQATSAPKTPSLVYVPDLQQMLGEEAVPKIAHAHHSRPSIDGLSSLPPQRRPTPLLERVWSGEHSLPSFQDKKRKKKYRTWKPVPQVNLALDLELGRDWTRSFQDDLHRTASESKQKTIAEFLGSKDRA